jgi:hypothetical protein
MQSSMAFHVLTLAVWRWSMQAGQRAMLRYTEFTSNECLPDTKTQPRIENVGQLDRDDTEHSVLTAVDGLEDLVKKMSIGEKAMFFTSFDLGYVRDLQVAPQWPHASSPFLCQPCASPPSYTARMLLYRAHVLPA